MGNGSLYPNQPSLFPWTPPRTTAKELGAFYTHDLVADFLVGWAVRSASDTVLDPSFGGGVFLRAAVKRLGTLGGRPASQVFGVELDEKACSVASDAFPNKAGFDSTSFRRSDFFELEPSAYLVDAVVGNPPFIRYQRFSGEMRHRALKRATSQGVRLSELSSSWAPFLVHAISMVRAGGRLAMVVPYELSHASYALPILKHLAGSFGSITFVTFQKKIFDDLNEDTMLLLAEDKGKESAQFRWKHLSSLKELPALSGVEQAAIRRETTFLDQQALCRGEQRLVEYVLPEKVRTLYHYLKGHPSVKRLGDLAYVGIGYVTGANDFFHVSPSSAMQWQIPGGFLKKAVRRGRSLRGIRFTLDDWQDGLESQETSYLLHIQQEPIPSRLSEYLNLGMQLGIPGKYKCRARSLWYSVPHVVVPHGFLTYMSGASPKLVANSAGAVAPNTLHIVQLHAEVAIAPDCLAALWQNSLTALSSEIEGHALGGGMLKLEPGEARKVLLPFAGEGTALEVMEELDEICRSKGPAEARQIGDNKVLRKVVGLSKRESELLRFGATLLHDWRNRRKRGKAHAT